VALQVGGGSKDDGPDVISSRLGVGARLMDRMFNSWQNLLWKAVPPKGRAVLPVMTMI
jgi:hypothetical protein